MSSGWLAGGWALAYKLLSRTMRVECECTLGLKDPYVCILYVSYSVYWYVAWFMFVR